MLIFYISHRNFTLPLPQTWYAIIYFLFCFKGVTSEIQWQIWGFLLYTEILFKENLLLTSDRKSVINVSYKKHIALEMKLSLPYQQLQLLLTTVTLFNMKQCAKIFAVKFIIEACSTIKCAHVMYQIQCILLTCFFF